MTHGCNVALLQLAACDRENFFDGMPTVVAAMNEAIETGAELIVLPEGTVPAYVLGTRPLAADECADAYATIEGLARKHRVHVVCGGAHRPDATAPPENAALVFGPDGPIAAVGKRFLWHFDRHWYRAGASVDPVVTSLGKLGVLVCADGRLPNLSRELVDRGAELLVVSTAWVTNAADPTNLENAQADLIARVRAWENGVPLLAANKCGVERRSVRYCGKSQAIAADGTLLALASSKRPEIVRVRVEWDVGAPHRCAPPKLANFAPPPRVGAPVRAAIAHSLDAGLRETAEWSDVAVCFVHGPQESRATTAAGPFVVDVAEYADGEMTPGPLPALVVGDAQIADPGYLPPLRLRGVTCCAWRADEIEPERRALLARTRATELRMYVVVLDSDARHRSFVVDPDGAILCGTDEDFLLPQFVFDPGRVAATLAAPGSDILEALEMIERLCARPAP